MTLKERLFNAIFDNVWELNPKNVVPDCEKIADEFAIGFTYWYEWCDYRALKNIEELLEIYKKEKGL